MMACSWTEDLVTGDAMMDRDHRYMVGLIGKLHDAAESGKGRTIIALVFEELISYTASHFGREEKLMREIRYPDFARHKVEHDELVAEVAALKRDFDCGKLELSSEIFLGLADWLLRHIEASDKRLGAASRSRRTSC